VIKFSTSVTVGSGQGLSTVGTGNGLIALVGVHNQDTIRTYGREAAIRTPFKSEERKKD
jgi:hypothetical protein